MNQKEAKSIRRLIRRIHKLEPSDRAYVTAKEGRKIVRTGRLTLKGEPEVVVMHWRTIKLHPDCPRALYQQMKAAA